MGSFFRQIQTKHLTLSPLKSSDARFIFELVDSQGWKTFIGDFKMDTLDKAKGYIEKIQAAEQVYYWVVTLNKSKDSLGLITFLKRDSLEYYDLGFAFLPEFENKGYALEASLAVLNILPKEEFEQIQAVTIPSNTKSIKLLEKLGFALSSKNLAQEKSLIFIKDLS